MKKRNKIMVTAIILCLLIAAFPAEASVFCADRFEPSLYAPAEARNLRAADDAAGSGHSEKDGSNKKKFEFPKIDPDFHFDAVEEKKKLTEAIRTLDEYGFTPEKLVERFWSFFNRRENREKIGQKTEELKEKTGEMIDKTKIKESPKK